MKTVANMLVTELKLSELKLNGLTDYQTISPFVSPYASALGMPENRLVWAVIDAIRSQQQTAVDPKLLAKLQKLG